MSYPDDLRYTAEHEWIRLGGESARVGITAYAQEALGDIVYVSLPEVGAEVHAGEPFGEIESTKSVSEVFAPLTGTVSGRNDALEGSPDLVNADPYGDGWLVEIKISDPGETDRLLDAAGYEQALPRGE